MTHAPPTTESLETALRSLDVLLKASRFYPPGHPALKTAMEQALQKLAAVVAGRESLALTVHKEGFRLGEETLPSRNPALKSLALQLFARHVRTLLFLPDLNLRDLHAFARCLAPEPPEIQKSGGIQSVLKKACVATIWVNEIDLANILEQKSELEAGQQAVDESEPQTPEAIEVQPEEQGLAQLLNKLERTESDQHFGILANKVAPLMMLHLNDAGRPLVLRGLNLFCRCAANRQAAPPRRQAAQQTLDQLCRDELYDFLVVPLCRPETAKEPRDQLLFLVLCFRGKIERNLMQHLAREADPQCRKILSGVLLRLGATAIPILVEYLKDSRWYVVRNAIGILGEIRDRKTTEHLIPMFAHEDIRVRRETIRAMTKIGGPGAEGTLLQILNVDDSEMRRQAILSLGALRCVSAIRPLLELAAQKDGSGQNLEERKEAVRALGQIGCADAIPGLKAMLKRRRFWFGAKNDSLRAEVVLALGKIGTNEVLPLLQTAIEDRSDQVARAARLALNRLDKSSHET